MVSEPVHVQSACTNFLICHLNFEISKHMIINYQLINLILCVKIEEKEQEMEMERITHVYLT